MGDPPFMEPPITHGLPDNSLIQPTEETASNRALPGRQSSQVSLGNPRIQEKAPYVDGF